MKPILFTFAVLITLARLASAADYTIDLDHTSLTFKVKHLGVSTTTGHFDKFTGTVSFDPKNLKTLKASATVEATSINTGNQKRDDHLRNEDFFDTTKHPQLKFVSKEVNGVSGQKFKLVGDLTMRGVTKTITLDGEFGGVTQTPWGDTRAGFTATTTVKRNDFGITGGKAGALVGEDVTIILEVEAIEKKDAK